MGDAKGPALPSQAIYSKPTVNFAGFMHPISEFLLIVRAKL